MEVTFIQAMGSDKKRCRCCLEDKLLTEFPIRKDRSGRLRPYCNTCTNSINRSRYKSHSRNQPFKLKATKAKARAKILNIPYNLTAEYLESIWIGVCPVLHKEIYLYEKQNEEFSAELDRFVPNLGYVKGNVHFLSRKANRIKNNSSIEDIENLLNWMKKNAIC